MSGQAGPGASGWNFKRVFWRRRHGGLLSVRDSPLCTLCGSRDAALRADPRFRETDETPAPSARNDKQRKLDIFRQYLPSSTGEKEIFRIWIIGGTRRRQHRGPLARKADEACGISWIRRRRLHWGNCIGKTATYHEETWKSKQLACHVADIPIAIFTDKLDRTLLASLVGLDQAELLSEPNIIKREIATNTNVKKNVLLAKLLKKIYCHLNTIWFFTHIEI